MQTGPLLVVFSGLPGTGKTTVARALAARLGAVFLRIDVIEQAMRAAGVRDIGPAGYAAANALAESNLLLGRGVIADCVNPVRASRLGWRAAADRASAALIDIHLVCSNPVEHRRRVEKRSPDITGLVLPTWDQVVGREFEERDDRHVRLDTAALTPAELVYLCERHISGERSTLSCPGAA